ncbi:uncharacterized protein I303_105527 [Kwoniella dejecticola CBS 10117]|uniref:Guanine deaminase n=1 Tax=Kwoniella dejecticola CBS 10117 TaxID=1296121 RepID=A0A1A6A2A5_9TREE|nr:guanine deaminase [Kwoniella dejecticola CBS 10117]OBR84174.1 guanine deaminase [Kwoniella dejecticola CBS 10117]
MGQLFVGTFVDTPCPGELRIRQDHLLVVDEKGYITHIAPIHDDSSQSILSGLSSSSPSSSSSSSSIPMELGKHSFLLPVFTDLHIHAAQYLFCGLGLDLPLIEWLERYAYKAEERVDGDPALAERVYGTLVKRLLQNGTGCVSFFGTIGVRSNLILAKKMQEAGLRGFVGKLSMDQSPRPTYGETSASASLDSLNEFLDSLEGYLAQYKPHEKVVEPIITPRYVPVCSDELLGRLKELGDKRGVRVQSHMCEGRDQMGLVYKQRGKRDQDIWNELGFLGPKTLQAHVTYLDDEMIPLIKDREVTIAHCPLSNAYLSEKQFPLREALDKSLNVGLGTDVAGGYTLSIQNQMRQAVIISRLREGARCENMDCSFAESANKGGKNLSVDWVESIYLATRGGKKGMGLGGCLEVGMEFDAQLIELADEGSPSGVGALDLFDLQTRGIDTEEEWKVNVERWWCNGDDRNRKGMWVQGRKVL